MNATDPISPPWRKVANGCALAFLIFMGLGVLVILVEWVLWPPGSYQPGKESTAMMMSRSINLVLYEYSTDHNGQYPPGKTSTEVFQKLLDEKYANDPGLFYIPMPGKTKPTSDTLTAANVCFDVTGGAGPKSSDQLPLVFLTGYTVTYVAGASAVCDDLGARPFPGIAVAYKGNHALFLKAEPSGKILHFVPDDITAGSEQYTQLRP